MQSDFLTTENAVLDVFLSHNGHEKPQVRELRLRLMQMGLTVWMDEFDLLPGSAWIDEIEKAIQKSRAILVAVGNSGLGRWEHPEIRCALIEMVRRQATVIPILLPDAPPDLELPLFLQTLMWVDFRNGFDATGLDKIRASIEHSNAEPEPKPLPRYVPSKSEDRLTDFWKFATDLRSMSGWIVRSSAIAPVVPVVLGFGPPWDGTNRWTEAGSVILMTTVTQFLAITASYFLFPPLSQRQIRRMLLSSVLIAVAAFIGYLVAFVLLTEVQPDANTRLIAGFSYSEEFCTVLAETEDPIHEVKLGFGYRPLAIYKPWTVWCALLLLVMAWLTCFGAIALYTGLFVRHISGLKSDGLLDNRPLNSLRWVENIVHPLSRRNVVTVADLCSMSLTELQKVFERDAPALFEIQNFFKSTGLPSS